MVRTILALLALGAFHSLFYLVAAQKQETVTLLVPVPMGTDVAGEILGVDDQGRTTYVLKELASDKSAIATATVVEAADHVSFAVNGRTPDFTGAVGFNCALDTKNQNALCLNPAGATATRALSRLFKVTVTGAAPVSTKEGAAAPRMRAGWTVWGVLLAGAYYQLA